MPLQATSGAASYDAFGGGVAAVPNYIEDVFSTYLFETNTPSDVTVPNGIDLSGEGGLVWNKCRNDSFSHQLYDTNRGGSYQLQSNTTNAQSSYFAGRVEFGSDGFVWKSSGGWSTNSFVSWTFRKAQKFFDVVTYTGNGNNTQTISHNLGSTPGCIITKLTSGSDSWRVYHRSLSTSDPGIKLNSTAAGGNSPYDYGDQSTVTSPTSTQFTAGINLNASGSTYVAYLFAHDAGGFGLTGTDNVISCGSFTPSGGVATVNLGFEPQWILSKTNSTGYFWRIVDNMRGIPVSPAGSNSAKVLYPNSSNTEASSGDISPTATGFTVDGQPDFETIYIAIRRGPMKVPTSGTSVFAPVTYTGNATARTLTTDFPVDLNTSFYRPGYSGNTYFYDRLRGSAELLSSSTSAEGSTGGFGFASNVGITLGTSAFNGTGETYINYMMQRAPSFFDEVCYTGTGSATTFSHNLGVAPEMMIVKGRTNTFSWFVYQKDLTSANESFLTLNTDSSATSGSAVWNSTSPTSSVFSVGSANAINQSGNTYVAYLFATCAGVSKVGSYTGTGTTKQIDCGFTGGARFVLIKRTDSTGDWYVWDSARGIVAGNDPYLLLNSTAAEVTNTDYVDTYSAGFEISSTAPAAINASGGSFIFLAIA